jgi:hypothetical protein
MALARREAALAVAPDGPRLAMPQRMGPVPRARVPPRDRDQRARGAA